MEFNFDINKTQVARSAKISSFPLFKYAKILSWFFLYLFAFSFLLLAASFLGIMPPSIAIKVSITFLFLFLLFLEIFLFTELKIKKPKIQISLKKALLNPKHYNLAEFLNLQVCQIVQRAIKKNRHKKLLGVGSESLLYFALKQNNDCQALVYRLGMDVKNIQINLKNYLEKSQLQGSQGSSIELGQYRFNPFGASFLESFKKVIWESAKIAVDRGSQTIGEKEILVALAKHDEFFKKTLVDYDLKDKDVENITLWLDAIEKSLEKSKKFWTRENLSRFGSLGRDFASGFTVTLDQFSIDWDKVVRNDIFNEIIGHKKEIDDLEIVLVKSRLSNALIVGDAGVGRKSIVRALAQRCYLGTGLSELYQKRVVELNMVHMLSQIGDQEKLEATLDQIFMEVSSAGNVILVIDELSNFIEQKSQKPGVTDISSILAKYLLVPDFHFIGITSFEGLHRKLEQNPSFVESFRKIEVTEISELETIRILQNMALGLEQKYKILITYPSIREIINLTGRYFPSTPFPKKAIDVLDEAAAYVNSLKEKVVLPLHIAKIISSKTQIPVGKMEFKEKSVLLDLENLIHQRIIGQEEAVKEVSIALRRARSGLGSKKRPMGVFLFLGPTGVGKTETAKALAQIYFNPVARDSSNAGSPDSGEDKMIRIDMSEFQSISDIPRLIGAISPVEILGLLTTPVRENPFSLVLVDEIEKAHPNILNLFLQIFDEGHITDGQGRKIIFTNTIIICTSNAGANIIFKKIASGGKIEKSRLFDFLFEEGIFKPEFINRFDATVYFNPLTKENLLDIAQLSLLGLQKNLKEKDIDFIITESLKEKIVELSYKPEFGAREMRRVVQDKIENIIAQALLSDKIVKGDKIEINPEDFSIRPHL